MVVILRYKTQIAADFAIPAVVPAIFYALCFLVAASLGRAIDPFFQTLGIRRSVALGATLLLVGQVIASFSQSGTMAVVALILISGGLAPFLGPLTAYAAKSAAGFVAMTIGLASAGQLTAFGAWGIFLNAVSASGWRDGLQTSAITGFVIALVSLWPMRAPSVPLKVMGLSEIRLRSKMTAPLYMSIAAAGTITLAHLSSLEPLWGYVSAIVIFSCSALVGRILLPLAFDRGLHRLATALGTASMFLGAAIALAFGSSPVTVAASAALLGFGYGGGLPILVALSMAGTRMAERAAARLFQWGAFGLLLGAALSDTWLGAAPATSTLISTAVATILCGLLVIQPQRA